MGRPGIYVRTAEIRRKQSEANKGHTSWSKGKKFSPEHLRNMSEAQKGKRLGEKCPEQSARMKGNKLRLGIPHTEETKLKMRRTHATPEYLKNMSEKHKGKKLVLSEKRKKQLTEQARIMGFKNRYHKHSEAAKKKMSDTRIKEGTFAKEKNPQWKGGITPVMTKVRNDFRYRQWRSDIFTRDNYTCQDCGQRGGDLQAHHAPKSFASIFSEYKILSFEQALACEELWNINNGQTLCFDCHKLKKGGK